MTNQQVLDYVQKIGVVLAIIVSITAFLTTDTPQKKQYYASSIIKKETYREPPKIYRTERDFFKYMSKYIDYDSGVPACITLAQTALETGFGKSNYYINGNNPLGLSNSNGVIEYTSVEAAFYDYYRRITTYSRYERCMQYSDDYMSFAVMLQECGYAEDSEYSKKLISLIQKYKLTNFEKPKKV